MRVLREFELTVVEPDEAEYHEPDWPKLTRSRDRDRIPFLEALVGMACRQTDLTGRFVFASDDRSGFTSLYVARRGCQVTCCVAGARENAELSEALKQDDVRNVSIVVRPSRTRDGPAGFPMIGRRFDAAVVVLSGLGHVSTDDTVRETARLLTPSGSLLLVALAYLLPSRPAGRAAQAGVERISLSARRELAPPLVASVLGAGFHDAAATVVKLSCEAPSYRDYLEFSHPLKPLKRPSREEPALFAMDEPKGPVPMGGFAILLRAEARPEARDDP